jgi:hypothetical protein
VVVGTMIGRLANRLTLYAHVAAAAADHGFVAVQPNFGPYARYFPTAAREALPHFPAGARRWAPAFPQCRRISRRAALVYGGALHQLQRHGLDVGLIRLARSEQLDLGSDAFLDVLRRHRVVVLQDWFFRTPEGCERHRDAIVRHLTPYRPYLDRAAAVAERARTGGATTVGVHIRRGDYDTYKDGRYFWSPAEYRLLMERAAAGIEGHTRFVLCSDEPVSLEEFAGLDVLRGEGHELVDLHTLAACDRILGPPSTYSSWASYYGDTPLWAVAALDEEPHFVARRRLSELPYG